MGFKIVVGHARWSVLKSSRFRRSRAGDKFVFAELLRHGLFLSKRAP